MTVFPPGLPNVWIEIAEYTLDASRVIFETENYPVACELAWGAAENAVKAAIFENTKANEVPLGDYQLHDVPTLYKNFTIEDSLEVMDSIEEFRDYNEYVRYPKWIGSSEIQMPADKYTETKAEKALVSAGLILDAARTYVA